MAAQLRTAGVRTNDPVFVGEHLDTIIVHARRLLDTPAWPGPASRPRRRG